MLASLDSYPPPTTIDMSPAINEQAARQLEQVNSRLSNLLSVNLSTIGAGKLPAYNEEVAACLATINLLQGIINPQPAVAPDAPSTSIPSTALAAPAAQAGTPAKRTVSHVSREEMLPPPEAAFPTADALLEYCNNWAYEHGYDLVKRGQSRPGVWGLECGRAGTTKNTRNITPESRQRKRKTRKCGCKFRMWIVHDEAEDTYSVQHYQKTEPHNHDAAPFGTAVANDRRKRRTKAIQNRIIEEYQGGFQPREINALLQREYPDAMQSIQDIRNVISGAKLTSRIPPSGPKGPASKTPDASSSAAPHELPGVHTTPGAPSDNPPRPGFHQLPEYNNATGYASS